MLRFAYRPTKKPLASMLLMGMLIALTSLAVRAAEEEKEDKLDLPWAKQMTYNNDPVKAAYAIRWLGEQKTNDAEAIKLIVEHLGDERDSNPPTTELFAHQHPYYVGHVAANALANIGQPIVPELIKVLQSDAKPLAKIRGLFACQRLGAKALDAFPAVAKLAQDQGDLELRGHALKTLSVIAAKPEQLVAVFAATLHDKDLNIQTMRELTKLGPAAHKFIPDLIKLLVVDPESVAGNPADTTEALYVAVVAAETLAEMGTATKAALLQLALNSKVNNQLVRLAAAYAQAAISGERTPGYEYLLQELENPEPGQEAMQINAQLYLMRLARQGKFPNETLPTFQKMLQHKDSSIRWAVIDDLVILKSTDAEKLLLEVSEKDSDSSIRSEAMRTLEKLQKSNNVPKKD